MSVTRADLDAWGHRIEKLLDDRFLTLTGIIGQLAQTIANNETRRQRDMEDLEARLRHDFETRLQGNVKDYGDIISNLASHMDRRFDEIVPRVDNHERRITALERTPVS